MAARIERSVDCHHELIRRQIKVSGVTLARVVMALLRQLPGLRVKMTAIDVR